MEKHKVICPYCGAGCQFNLLVQNGQVVGPNRSTASPIRASCALRA